MSHPSTDRWTDAPHRRERLLLAEPFLPEPLVADQHARLCAIQRITVEDVLANASALLDASLAADREARAE